MREGVGEGTREGGFEVVRGADGLGEADREVDGDEEGDADGDEDAERDGETDGEAEAIGIAATEGWMAAAGTGGTEGSTMIGAPRSSWPGPAARTATQATRTTRSVAAAPVRP